MENGDVADMHAYFAKALDLFDEFSPKCAPNVPKCHFCLSAEDGWKEVSCHAGGGWHAEEHEIVKSDAPGGEHTSVGATHFLQREEEAENIFE